VILDLTRGSVEKHTDKREHERGLRHNVPNSEHNTISTRIRIQDARLRRRYDRRWYRLHY
jgi:hypothetical protein